MQISLRQKIVYATLVTTIVIYTVSFLYILVSLKKNSEQDAVQIVKTKARLYASKIAKELSVDMGVAQGMASSMFDYEKLSAKQKRKQYDKVIKRSLKYSKSYEGTWYCWQLSEFSHTWGNKPGRVLGAYLHDKKGILEIFDSLDIGGIKEFKGYHSVMKNKKEAIFEPYRDFKINILETTLAYPIVKHNKFAGLVGIDIDLSHFQKIIKNIKLYKLGYAFILSNQGRYVYHPDTSLIDSSFAAINSVEDSVYKITEHVKNGEELSFYGNYTGTKEGIFAFLTPIKIGKTTTPWSIGILVFMDEVMAQSNIIMRNTMITGIVGLIILLVILLTVTNYAFRSVNKGVEFAKKISEGDLTTTLEVNSKDEIGQLAQALNIMVNHFREMIFDMKKSAGKIEEFAKEIKLNTKEYEQIADNQKNAAGLIDESISNISSNITISHDNTVITESISNNAMEKLAQSSKLISETLNSMNEIANHITVIGEIAEQTDILAINASIEASRAGEQGKGFSVVAQEVRKLSERSSVAAKQINEITQKGLTISSNTGDMINLLQPEMQKTASLVKEIAELSLEQTKSIEEIVRVLVNFNQISDENLNMAQKMGISADTFSELTDNLNLIISKFKI